MTAVATWVRGRVNVVIDAIFIGSDWRRLSAESQSLLLEIARMPAPPDWDYRRKGLHDLYCRGLLTSRRDIAELTFHGRNVANYGLAQRD
jgi:hypothetical protein